MTHDELLAKIDMFINSADLANIYDMYEFRPPLKALRAVVELHKPITDMNGYSACEECSRIAYYNVPYPCLTNQAIEKELE